MPSKLLTMREAINTFVEDAMTIAIEGFTAGICFAAGHEIIRQDLKDLTLCRMTPDLIYDQMVAAGCARKLVFSYLGNPGVGSLHCIRRAVERGSLELEEYTHLGMLGRYSAAASNLPFFPMRSYAGTDLPKANPLIRFVKDPYLAEEIAVVPPLKPDVTIIHTQRADAAGNVQSWGIAGAQKEAAYAAKHVLAVVEEVVDEHVIRSDPDRTLIPSFIVDAVIHEPAGAHPSFVQGYWDRDNAFYREWNAISRDEAAVDKWIEEWVLSLADRTDYRAKIPESRWSRLRPRESFAEPINYGLHQ
jgi:glutaconate CoA-transferase subunit A